MILSEVSDVKLIENCSAAYAKWSAAAKAKAEEFYKDPFDGDIKEDKKIPCLHHYAVGGTVSSAVCGVNPFVSPAEAYENFTQFKEQEDKFVFRRGHAFEKFVWTEASRVLCRRVTEGTIVSNPVVPWLVAQIDAQLGDGTPLECKVVSSNRDDENGKPQWGNGCKFNDAGIMLLEDSQIPVYYLYQCQQQLLMTGKDSMFLACWIVLEDHVRIYTVHRNEEIITEIISKTADFMLNHVIPGVPYEQKETPKLEETQEQNSVIADVQFLNVLTEYRRLSSQKSEIAKRLEKLDFYIRDAMGSHTKAVALNGDELCHLTPSFRTTFDSASLANAYPEIYSKFLRQAAIKPRLTLSKKIN